MKRFLSRRPIVTAVVASVITLAVSAHAALSAVGESQTAFRAVGPGGLKIDGTGSGVTASESNGVITVTAPINNLKTGMSLRDDHLKKAINGEKYPNAKFEVARTSLQFPEDQKTVKAGGKGKFTLNNVTKEVPFEYEVSRTGSDYHVKGKTTLDITAFGLEKPCYLGVCVEKTVQVKVSFKLREG